MSRFILYRLALLVPTLFGVLLVTFLLLYVAPGDPVQAMVGERADAETSPGSEPSCASTTLTGIRAIRRWRFWVTSHQLHHPAPVVRA